MRGDAVSTIDERIPLPSAALAAESASTPVPERAIGELRVTFVDNARAIGIVLVVVGHAPALAGWASDFIYAFHMPLFFCLSGLVVNQSRLAMTMAGRALHLARTLLLPYLFFFLLSYAYWLVAKRHGLRAAEFEALPWWHPLAGFIQGTADGLYVDVVLWFFPCLFITAVVHHALRQRLSAATTAVLSTFAAFLFIVLHDSDAPRWWWSADCAVIGLAYFSLGAAFNGMLGRGREHGRVVASLLAVSLLPATLLLSRVTGHVDLNHLVFGAHPLLYLPVGAVGTIGVLALAAVLRASEVGRWLSRNTLIIFPLHFILFSVITGVAIVVFGLTADAVKTQPLTPIGYTVVALLLCWPASKVLRRPLQMLMRA